MWFVQAMLGSEAPFISELVCIMGPEDGQCTVCGTMYNHPVPLPYCVPFSLGCLVQKDRDSPRPHTHIPRSKRMRERGREAERKYEYVCKRQNLAK